MSPDPGVQRILDQAHRVAPGRLRANVYHDGLLGWSKNDVVVMLVVNKADWDSAAVHVGIDWGVEAFQVDHTRGLLCPWCPPVRSGMVERKILIRECQHDPFKLQKKLRQAVLERDQAESNGGWWKAQFDERLAQIDRLKTVIDEALKLLEKR